MDPPRDRPASRSGSDFASPDRLARVLAIALELSCRIGLLPRRSVAWPGGIRSRPVPVRQARVLMVDTKLVAPCWRCSGTEPSDVSALVGVVEPLKRAANGLHNRPAPRGVRASAHG